MRKTNYINYCNLPYANICVGFTTNESMFDKELKFLGLPDGHLIRFIDDDAAATTHYITRDNLAVIIITLRRDKRYSKEYPGLLVHEAVHAWQYLKGYINEDHPGAEIEAYHIQHIFDFIYQDLLDGN